MFHWLLGLNLRCFHNRFTACTDFYSVFQTFSLTHLFWGKFKMKETMIIISTYFVTLPIFECSFHVEYLSGNLTLNQQLPLVTPCAEPMAAWTDPWTRTWNGIGLMCSAILWHCHCLLSGVCWCWPSDAHKQTRHKSHNARQGRAANEVGCGWVGSLV